ncbi:MAG: hypothetical protein JWM59_1349 [Verrucomicrobiales bacterium]|nr:hypothetical protein [Verrucomicrobiales bacterium]
MRGITKRLPPALLLAVVSAFSLSFSSPLRAEEKEAPSDKESTGAAVEPAFRAAVWKPVFQGVDLAEITAPKPRPIRAQVLRVDLAAPGVRLLATPDNGEAPGETTSQFTSSFLKAWRCQAAVNAAPFDKVYALEGLPEDIVGLQISDGKVVSPASSHPALLQMKDGTLRISAPPFPLEEISQAVCGFQIILKNGKSIATDTKLHPRTGAAISGDGKTLWLLTVDGRQAGYSEGCTTVEMGTWFTAMGATDAINLDGGGTTTMVMADAQGNPKVINRPIQLGIPGRERPSGSHLGVFANPLSKAGNSKSD